MNPSPELLLRHAKTGPRYTSYPTAPVWRADFPEAARAAALRVVAEPASVYVHIPFCAEQCSFCGCSMAVAGRREAGTRYLDDLERQLARLALPKDRVDVVRIHLGGGTPTWLNPDELIRLYALLETRFRRMPGAEISVEADPEVTADEHVEALAQCGVTRLSLGVQSFDPVVLAAVNRPQRYDRVAAILELGRKRGMHSLNLDLIYGLPYDNAVRFEATVRTTLTLRPDRLAIFGYAHVPWLKPHQKKIPVEALPSPVERMALFLLAHELLTDAGYQAIGMDHFALKDDELSVSQRAGTLHRNFMGYTTRPDVELIGVGMSAISEFRDCYVQDKSKLAHWWKAVEADEPLVEKGCMLTAEDRLRREFIERLLCNFTVPFRELGVRHGVDVASHFRSELEALAPLEADGLVERHADRVDVTELGRFLVRNVAMVFDAYLPGQTSDGKPRFSQTV